MTSKQAHHIMLLGFGTVAQGLCRILDEKREELLNNHNFDFKIVSVVTRSRGTMYNPDGLPLSLLLELAKTNHPFSDFRTEWDTETAILKSNADIVVELTHTNIETGEPALGYCRAALSSGKHLICGNKGPATLAYDELMQLAKTANKFFLNEATVLSGTPILSLGKKVLAGTRITRIRGILNGATNFILSEMEAGSSRETVLARAEELGYLEADHRADIDGFDAQAKVVILANALMGLPLKLKDVKRTGIGNISAADVQTASENGNRWKLIGTIEIKDQGFHAEVAPVQLNKQEPLAQVMGTTNALTLTTDLLGDVTISGPGAGSVETGYGILSDLLTINRGG